MMRRVGIKSKDLFGLKARQRVVRNLSTSAEVTFDIPTEFKTFLCDAPPQTATATKEELLKYHEVMYRMRRMEISCDQEYKARNIRGFCHLYDGQEAVATGIEAAIDREDDWITTYRCHGVALARGCTVQEIFEELFGFEDGVVKGKGGSMHLYNKSTNFYGGAAIVGAQVPVGTGLAFYHKYMKDVHGKENSNIAIAAYGDGSANQGQVWEAANMASLWKLPMIYLCENNLYGMGTSVDRSSANTDYYKQGQGVIPGIFIDGMDVLAVREGMKFAKQYAGSGNGPIFVEVKTYRYHGHSMSDPGLTYRSRDEVAEMRNFKDPILLTKKRIVDAGFETEDYLKEIEKAVRSEVQEDLKKAKQGKEMEIREMLTDIFTSEESVNPNEPGWGKRLTSEIPKFVRMPDYPKSIFN